MANDLLWAVTEYVQYVRRNRHRRKHKDRDVLRGTGAKREAIYEIGNFISTSDLMLIQVLPLFEYLFVVVADRGVHDFIVALRLRLVTKLSKHLIDLIAI